MAEPQTDVSRPSALPTALLRRDQASHGATSQQPQLDATEYLDSVQEDLNKRVDVEVEILVDGMADLIELAKIGEKDKFRIAQEAFQIEMRAEGMVMLILVAKILPLTHLRRSELLIRCWPSHIR
jgi:mediator of RNA polymerase II transcription subunit 22